MNDSAQLLIPADALRAPLNSALDASGERLDVV